ncbi:uncharacterized protein [Nicotiana tomentosiformis]|uniref:uncharacterized protein n=1 Tax=Nicotiana tomentosiformis TaxID=4098 RepID=UPI00388C42E6
MGLDEEVKRRFWEGLDEIVRQVPPAEKIFIGEDFNGHIGSTAGGYGEKREEHLVTFQNVMAKTQIDYLLLMRCDRGFCKDCKVILGDILAMQHRLLVMDVGIMLKRRKRSTRERLRIRWGALTKDKAQALEGQLSAMGAWRSNGDMSTMWSATADYIRKAAREVLGVSTGISGRHKGDWWWNEVVQAHERQLGFDVQNLVDGVARFDISKLCGTLVCVVVSSSSFECIKARRYDGHHLFAFGVDVNGMNGLLQLVDELDSGGLTDFIVVITMAMSLQCVDMRLHR